ncbi:cyclic nucleotide-gated cation channel alpha-3-like isoform X2 [Varroa jacobsoni]|uniref:cyclic nucleotide-gated cation channel alpha-3-like isoform X2 n=1 Tax=Varroa jacobsoni TaxID=62625 RepID=UPI000BFA192F|nr:cyclic nucleotide-gated cation channel alpha-3-like isoform X2 [Varroa jacobsoni]
MAGLRTRAGLTQSPADGGTQLRSRTTSRSNVSLAGVGSQQATSDYSPPDVETVAGKVPENGAPAMSGATGNRPESPATGPTRSDQVAVEIPKKTREQRRKEIKREFEKWDLAEKSGCRWTFVFDPSGRLCYYWSLVVSIAFLYNFWVIIYRFSFSEITMETLPVWFTLDYMADFLYVLDICFHFRTGYLDEGVLQTDGEKLRNHYLNSTMFYIDALCLLPLDFLYLSIRFNSILRGFRLVKIYRFWAFLDRTERHTNYPNVFRAINLTHYVLVIFHWNACIAHIIDKNEVFGSGERWFNNSLCGNDTMCEYLHAFYWSTLSLTTVGDLPRPRTKGQYLFLVIQLVLGLFLFATVLGHVANIVTNVSAARKEFQAKLDAVKTYMRMRHVPDHLQNKVIRWFDYLWMTQKSSDEERSVGCLPDKLKAEIAIHVHLDTLKRVEIFQNTEAGFLCELVLRLRPVLFSPGDYICRKGEVGKEMYIVNRGKLQVVADDGKTVLATLRAGSYFGEISILNMGTAGNRRTASVRSVGYSDLFCLYKHDMWDVLKDYPAARVRLEAIAVKRLEKYKKEPIKKMAMGRSRSTPGLLESRGKKTLEDTSVRDDFLTRPKPAKASSTCSSPSGQRESHAPSYLENREQQSGCCIGSGTPAAGTQSGIRVSGQSTGHVVHPSSTGYVVYPPGQDPQAGHAGPPSHSRGRSPNLVHHAQQHVHTISHVPGAMSGHSLHQQQPQPPSPLPHYLNLPATPHGTAGATTFTFQGPHAFIPIPTGTPVLASRSSPYTDYTNISPVSSNEPTTVAPPTALYGTSPGNSSTATGAGPSTHLLVPSPLQISGIQSGMHSPTPPASARNQEALLSEIKRLRERLVTLETENATMGLKLSQSTWLVENRLAEIEMHISTKNQQPSRALHPPVLGGLGSLGGQGAADSGVAAPTLTAVRGAAVYGSGGVGDVTDTESASAGSDSDERNRESII